MLGLLLCKTERHMLVLDLLSPSYSRVDSSPWNSATHTEGWSSLLSETSLETLSQTHPKVCFPGDSKTSEVDN